MVRIITDSAADFEPIELEKLNITCIPLTVSLGGADYQENINLSKDQFFELLASTGDTPKTAQPAPQLLIDLFEAARDAGDEAVYITISSAISGTYQTALMSRDEVDCDDCYVLDSKNATGGQRLLVEYAVRLRDEGKSAREIVAAVESIRDKIVLYACIDTLEYLYRGGRISQTVYKLGTMAQVSLSSGLPRTAVLKCLPRPWACAKVWTSFASGLNSSSPAKSTTCMSCILLTGPSVRPWPKRYLLWELKFPRSGSSRWVPVSAAMSAPMPAALFTWQSNRISIREGLDLPFFPTKKK